MCQTQIAEIDARDVEKMTATDDNAGHQICLIHPFDPRGTKIGGIETHVRQMLRHAPNDIQILFVGVDGVGDCRLGEVVDLSIGERTIKFLPILHFADDNVHAAASTLSQSLTMRFAVMLLLNLLRIRAAIGTRPTSIELQRFEFFFMPLLLGKPVIQIVHGEGSKKDKMDSLIRKYWFVHRMAETFAIKSASRVICVNPNIIRRIEAKFDKGVVSRTEFMSVPVDTSVFKARGFDTSDGVFRIVFAGRLDEFKDPSLMFLAMKAAFDRLNGQLEFHYVGTSDPLRYNEFEKIRAFTLLRGYQSPEDVAKIMAHCHAGMLTSFFEGMPCYLLELMSVGRPVVAIRLPQYDCLIEEGVSGFMIERNADRTRAAEELADRLVLLWQRILSGQINHAAICAKVIPFSAAAQMNVHYSRHLSLHRTSNHVAKTPQGRMG